VDFAVARERGVKSRYTRGPAFFEPFDQRLPGANTKPAKIEDLELGAAPGMQPGDALQGLQIVIKGRAHKNPDLQVVAAR
jgi:hypothetical protein